MIVGPLVFSPMYQSYLKGPYLIKYLYFGQILSNYQCRFRKGFNPQHCLIAMIEKWRSSNNKGNSFGALLTNLFKDFDCFSHKPIIAKLAVYGFKKSALKVMHNCLFVRKQRTKINIF